MMKILSFDHIVITTQNLEDCLHFYVDILGMKHDVILGQHALLFGNQKINIHTYPGEFQPAAKQLTYGSQDLCFVSEGNPEDIKKELIENGFEIVEGVVDRIGARGEMKSVYTYDPDGNLVEIAVY